MNRSRIEWCDYTWNPMTGCPHHFKCRAYCYARRLAEGRLRGRFGYPVDKPFEPTFHPDRISEVLKLRTPGKIFVCSMGDLFAAQIPREWIEQVLAVTRLKPEHTFIFLTKNPDRYHEFFFNYNCWLGTSISSLEDYRRLDHFYDIEQNIRWVSMEPLHGPITKYKHLLTRLDIDWLVVGAETGNRSGKIVPDPSWIVEIVEHCKANAIPLFIKDNVRFPSKGRHRQFPEV